MRGDVQGFLQEAIKGWTPVLHRYFEHEFGGSSRRLFDAQTTFVLSVAVNSVLCYAFGISDRHLRNILVDTTTGGVVHVDFGEAFWKGLSFGDSNPVPFRLTHELVDGMGFMKEKGLFRSTLTDVLAVLIKHKTEGPDLM